MPLSTPSNPLDAIILSNEDYADTYRKAYRTMATDPNIGLFGIEVLSDDRYDNDFMPIDAALEVFASTEKPYFILSGYAGFPQQKAAQKCLAAGVPFLWGHENALLAARNFLEVHCRREKFCVPDTQPATAAIARWQPRLREARILDEHDSLTLFKDFGIAVTESIRTSTLRETTEGATALGYPVALKLPNPACTTRAMSMECG